MHSTLTWTSLLHTCQAFFASSSSCQTMLVPEGTRTLETESPTVPNPWVNILPRNPYNAISTFFENLIFLTTPAPLFSGKCNEKPNTRPFLSAFRKNHFSHLKSPKK